MDNFQSPNYGFLSGLADGANGFLNAYMTVKNINHQQKMQEMATGVTKDGSGNYTYAPWKQQELDYQSQSAQHGMGMLKAGSPESESYIQNFNKTFGKNLDPDSMSGEDIKGFLPAIGNQIRGDSMMQGRIYGVNQGVHQKAEDAVTNVNKTLQSTYFNLKQAWSNFEAGGATKEEFEELQQAVRANLGIKGQSSVGERGSSYLKNAGVDTGDFMQFLTGNLQDVRKMAPNMVNAIHGLVNLELQNKQKQAYANMTTEASKHRQFYQQNPQLADDFNNTFKNEAAKFDMDEFGHPAQSQQQQQQSPPPKQAGLSLMDQKAKDLARIQELRAKQSKGAANASNR